MTAALAGPDTDGVRRYAAHVMGWSPDKTGAVTRFEHGNRHAVYRVAEPSGADSARDVVVRISYGADAADRAQAEREATVLDMIGGIAGPALYDFQSTSPWFDTPVMCLEFLPGSQYDMNSMTTDQVMLVGSVVATVHGQFTGDLSSELWGEGIGVDAYAKKRIEGILAALIWARDPLPAEAQLPLRDAAAWVAARFESLTGSTGFASDEPLRLLHGDIGPGNVLWNPSPCLIDWEYTRLGDPADEIAYTFGQNTLTEAQQEAFWVGYTQASAGELHVDEIRRRARGWLPVTQLGSALWWAERWVRRTALDEAGTSDPAVAREPAYYLDQLTARIQRLQGVLDRFAEE
jgi:aminoglycoside phosphotransferase (APT) family kinase protein